jgi:CDP-6-deoxy-D-xylo-4-hexulose-3-dehydrase
MKKIWYAPNKSQAYGDDEINAVLKCLKEGWLAGNGPKTEEFENKISNYFGKKYGVFVNSGSSANLLAIECLKKELNLTEETEVITSACTFSTTVSPIVQCGLKPVFCDVELTEFVSNIDTVLKYITKNTRIIMLPNLIGNKPDWKLLKIKLKEAKQKAENNNYIYLIEDSCDTMTYTEESDISTTSFYASHLITAGGSGGMIMFNDDKLRKKSLMFRDWGRIGDNSEKVEDRFNFYIDDIPYDWKFLYEVYGYNFKSSEMNAAFGLVQFDKIEHIKQHRRILFERYINKLKDNKLFILPNDKNKSDWLAFPLICLKNNRKDILTYLEQNNIQTRVLFSGNICKHPAYNKFKKSFTNSDIIMAQGFLLGCHHGMTIDDVDRVCMYLNNTYLQKL